VHSRDRRARLRHVVYLGRMRPDVHLGVVYRVLFRWRMRPVLRRRSRLRRHLRRRGMPATLFGRGLRPELQRRRLPAVVRRLRQLRPPVFRRQLYAGMRRAGHLRSAMRLGRVRPVLCRGLLPPGVPWRSMRDGLPGRDLRDRAGSVRREHDDRLRRRLPVRRQLASSAGLSGEMRGLVHGPVRSRAVFGHLLGRRGRSNLPGRRARSRLRLRSSLPVRLIGPHYYAGFGVLGLRVRVGCSMWWKRYSLVFTSFPRRR